MIRIGIIGANEGNGHPFSFASIINGYDSAMLRAAGWEVIADYLDRAPPDRVGFEGVSVTHVWTQDLQISHQIQQVAAIPNVASSPEELGREVDAVLIARDDWETHMELAMPLLRAGVAVFVDKPLTLLGDELAELTPYLRQGRLASYTGLRFAPELDDYRDIGAPLLVRGISVGRWDRYAVHVLEPALSLFRARPVLAIPHASRHDSIALELEDGALVQIDCVGDAPVPFLLELVTRTEHHLVELSDRFAAFRRALVAFIGMVETRQPPIEPSATVDVMNALIAGRAALAAGSPISLDCGQDGQVG